jgi:hypothetical protein
VPATKNNRLPFTGFCGGSYGAGYPLSVERTMNLIPELTPTSVDSEFRIWFRKAPGWGAPYVTLGNNANNPIQELFTTNNRSFGICGNAIYEITGPNATINRGTLPAPVNQTFFSLSSSGREICIATGGVPYIFNLNTNLLAAATAPPPVNLSQVVFIDGYFIGKPTGFNNAFYISNFYDGNTWNSLNFSQEEDPDYTISIATLHRSLWLLGEDHIQVYVDSGNASFPFTQDPSSYQEIGCIATQSPTNLDNTLMWLGGDQRGPAIAYRANGYVPTRISTHSEEKAWQSYPSVTGAIGSSYQQQGHLYWRLDFPEPGATWLYDVSSGVWHERGLWNPGTNSYLADTARYHTYNSTLNKHFVGDYASNKIYTYDLGIYHQDTHPLRWERITPAVAVKGLDTAYDQLEFLMQTGDIGSMAVGSEPMVMLRYSDDFGQTWSDEMEQGLGKQGNSDKRVLFDSLGSGRRRVFDFYGSDPCPTEIAGAWLSADVGTG